MPRAASMPRAPRTSRRKIRESPAPPVTRSDDTCSAPTAVEQIGLVADFYATQHIFAADGDGAQAVIELLRSNGASMRGCITIVYAQTALMAEEYAAELNQLPVRFVRCYPTVISAVEQLMQLFGSVRAGARIYAAGSQRLIDLVRQLAAASGMDSSSVLSDFRPALSHVVQCEICGDITGEVTNCFLYCAHCGTSLFVRGRAESSANVLRGILAEDLECDASEAIAHREIHST